MSSESTPTSRQVQQATTYYRASLKKPPKDAAAAPPTLIDSSPLHFSANQRMFGGAPLVDLHQVDASLQDMKEFVIKIDSSPVHFSANRRMFNKHVEEETAEQVTAEAEAAPPAPAQAEVETTPEEEEERAHTPEEKAKWSEFWSKMAHLYTFEKVEK
jgi:beta-phosphoglucomutase-like phosphatase (HAD superfamily)